MLLTENYSQYKARMMDPISASFCAAKWYNATIWLGSGKTASCHHPGAHQISVEAVKANPKALHNTPEKKVCREQMLKGERPSECEYCWKIEDMKRGNISDRVFKTITYSDHEVANIVNKIGGQYDVNLKTLEIAFDRTCNFACSYCSARFSTKWVQDLTRNGPYQNLSGAGVEYESPDRWEFPYATSDENPYVQAFWEWWPELSQSLKEIRITGGEPTMSTEFWKFFEFFKSSKSQMRFAVNTNLGMSDHLFEKFVENSHHVPRMDIYSSCEASGPAAEYIRDGMEYPKFQQRVHELLKRGKMGSFIFMSTINSLCLFTLTDFMDWALELKSEFGRYKGMVSVNILRHPRFMSAALLPREIQLERAAHLKQWLKSKEGHPMMHPFEIENAQRLIDHLECVDPISDPYLADELRRDMKHFFTQYDQRRGKSLAMCFPKEFVDWYNSISVERHPEPTATL